MTYYENCLDQSGHGKFKPSGQLFYGIGTKHCKRTYVCFIACVWLSLCLRCNHVRTAGPIVIVYPQQPTCTFWRRPLRNSAGSYSTLNDVLSPSSHVPGDLLKWVTKELFYILSGWGICSSGFLLGFSCHLKMIPIGSPETSASTSNYHY
jgi:hypothetical protein